MKYLLLITAMVIGSYCWGQKMDSLVFGKGVITTNAGRDSITVKGSYAPGGGSGGTITFFKQDTVKVLMLVCDTTALWASSMKYFSPCAQASNDGKCVWWQFGYEVKEPIVRGGMGHIWVDENGDIIWPAPTYLDQNKKPLPKSTVVWMTKEIKN